MRHDKKRKRRGSRGKTGEERRTKGKRRRERERKSNGKLFIVMASITSRVEKLP